MKLFLILLSIIIGIVLFLSIVLIVIWFKLKRTARKVGLGSLNVKDVISSMTRIKESESHRIKSISGMTNILIPNIIKDFPEFNVNQLYNITEESLRCIFTALSGKDKQCLKGLPLISDSISSIIDDYKENKIDVKYSDIVFHRFAIKDYNKIDGVATVTVNTSLEYYYDKYINKEKVISSRYKKQTRYSCKFIYIYDESLFKDYEVVLGVNCPNCGAPIKSLGHKYCEYCGSTIQEINLKSWEFSSYEEY